MTRMVDRSREGNRAIVVGLFTGSFGVGINASVILWGVVADIGGLGSMYVAGSVLMLIAAIILGAGLLTPGRRKGRPAECHGET
jgi:predicted MFS family arabinose efflux permease